MAKQSRQTLILTRPEGPSARFAAELAARFGDRLAVVIAPLMAPVFLRPALPEGPLDRVVFTSETGVAGLAALTRDRGRAICVGPRTAQAARDAGWRAEVVGGDAEGLVAALSARPPEGDWLHARGREAAGHLAERLNTAGMRVAEAVVYAQEPLPLPPVLRSLLDAGNPLLIPVFSPRSGRIFVAQAGNAAAPLHVAAISPAAALTMAPLRPARVAVAETPDGPGMLDCIGRLIATGTNA